MAPSSWSKMKPFGLGLKAKRPTPKMSFGLQILTAVNFGDFWELIYWGKRNLRFLYFCQVSCSYVTFLLTSDHLIFCWITHFMFCTISFTFLMVLHWNCSVSSNSRSFRREWVFSWKQKLRVVDVDVEKSNVTRQ